MRLSLTRRRLMLQSIVIVTLLPTLSSALQLTSPESKLLSTCSALTISGYVDNSYNYLLRDNRFVSGVYNRVNDITENGITLQQAALTFSVIPVEGVGGLLNVIGGQDAYSISPYGLNPNAFKSNNVGLTVPEAYFLYAVSQYTLYAGEMLSLSGIEQFDYGLDANFSRSILDGYAQPGTHVGFRVADQLNPDLRILGGINNGWSTVREAAKLDTAEFAVQYTKPEVYNWTIDGYLGRQHMIDNSTSGPMSNRYLLDIYGTWMLNTKVSVAMNYDYGLQTKALAAYGDIERVTWQAIDLYGTYYFTDALRTVIRGEVFNDSDGSRTGICQNWKELTFTLAMDVTKHLMVRAETRHDFSNTNAFLYKEGMSTSNNQQSYALEAYYAFSI